MICASARGKKCYAFINTLLLISVRFVVFFFIIVIPKRKNVTAFRVVQTVDFLCPLSRIKSSFNCFWSIIYSNTNIGIGASATTRAFASGTKKSCEFSAPFVPAFYNTHTAIFHSLELPRSLVWPLGSTVCRCIRCPCAHFECSICMAFVSSFLPSVSCARRVELASQVHRCLSGINVNDGAQIKLHPPVQAHERILRVNTHEFVQRISESIMPLRLR